MPSQNKPFYRKPSKDDAPGLKRSKSALPASASAVAKLSKFAFTKPAEPNLDEEEEPEVQAVEELPVGRTEPSHANETLSRPTTAESRPVTAQSTPRRTRSHLDAPHTPAPRVPLSQLTSTEDMPSATQPQDTPEERVVWQAGTPQHQTNDGNGLRKKRSGDQDSPILLDSPAGKRKSKSYSLADMGDSLKTPMDDPATQLWKSYGTDSDSKKNPATRLFSAAGIERSPLRRAISSPEGLPFQRMKRRRTAGLEHEHLSSDDKPKSPGTPVARKKARVSRLMDQVKKNIDRKPSPPPSPSRHNDAVFSSSPVRSRAKSADPLLEVVSETKKLEDSDEFGEFDDDDIDMGFLEEVDRVASTAQLAATQQQQTPNLTSVSITPINSFSNAINGDDDDEDFGDDGDDDFFTAELQTLVAQYDTPNTTQNGPTAGTGSVR